MKNLKIICLLVFFILSLTSCKDSSEEVVVVPGFPTLKVPKWSVENSNLYEFSMSSIVMLPYSLQSTENEYDELAVFCGTECRGVAERIKIASDTYVWMLLVYSHGMEKELLYFKYYSSQQKTMYKDTSYFIFRNNEKYGTFDNPIYLSLERIEE